MIQPSSSEIVASLREISEGRVKIPAARILVVDDDHLMRWAIAETLVEEGYDVCQAADGESAKHAITASDSPPDLVFLDLCLPDCDDLCMVSFIRAHAPAATIVLMTSYATPEIVERAMCPGVVVVTKPFDMNRLSGILDRAFAARPA